MNTTSINHTILTVSNNLAEHISRCNVALLQEQCTIEHREAFSQRLQTLKKCQSLILEGYNTFMLKGPIVVKDIDIELFSNGINVTIPLDLVRSGFEHLIMLKDSLYTITTKSLVIGQTPNKSIFYAEVIPPFEHTCKCSSKCNAILLESLILLEETNGTER